MTPLRLLAQLGHLGVRVVADGDRLGYCPIWKVPPSLLALMKAQKAALLDLLRPKAPEGTQPAAGWKCKCGSTAAHDVVLDHAPHNGQSVRRDCAVCRRFLCFARWYGEDTCK